MKQALILHCWYGSAKDNWYPWLKQELEKKGYKVHLPDLPELRKDLPDMENILSHLVKEYKPNTNTVVIGHSIGCLLTLRLAERVPLEKIVLVSGWDFDDLTKGHKLFWKNKIDHELIKEHVKDILVVHSDNDPYITAAQAEDMSKRLVAKFVLVKNAKHFTKEGGVTEIPQLLSEL